ncbi:MAG: hypothetical protein AB1679_15470 [Actinomycetota bacterium]
MRRIALCLFAVAGLGAGAACGGDDTPPLSSEEFVKQANAICKDRDARVAQEGKDILAKPNPSADELTEFFVKKAIPNAREKLEELGDLRPPTKDKAKVEKMLSAGEKALDAAEKGFKEGTSTTVRQDDGSELYQQLNKEFNELARELQLTDCAEKSS